MSSAEKDTHERLGAILASLLPRGVSLVGPQDFQRFVALTQQAATLAQLAETLVHGQSAPDAKPNGAMASPYGAMSARPRPVSAKSDAPAPPPAAS